jgi:hypothetical protein
MEKGSGTVKIFATTMTQQARKEGKGGEWKRAKVHDAGQGRSECQGTGGVDIGARPDRHPARMLNLPAAGRRMISRVGFLSRREASGLKNAHPEMRGVR